MTTPEIVANLIIIVQRMNADGLGETVHCNALQELCMQIAIDHKREEKRRQAIAKDIAAHGVSHS